MVEAGTDARYLPTGHLVYALGGVTDTAAEAWPEGELAGRRQSKLAPPPGEQERA